MKPVLFLAAGAALLAPLSAQTFHSTLPAGLLKTGGNYSSGNGVSYVFDRGAFHYQEVHRDWLTSVKPLTGAAFRRGWNRATNTTAVARQYDCMFRVGYGDSSTFSNTSFTANYKRGRTVVVGTETTSGQTPVTINLPDWTQKPATAPAPFNAVFPFSTTFVYDGKDEFIWELEIVKASVTGTTYYYCDRQSATGGTTSSTGAAAYVPASRPACNDSAQTTTTGAYTYGNAYVYNQNYSTASYRDKLRLYSYSYYTAPSATVVAAISPFPLPNGVNVGAVCNSLHFDATKPFFPVVRTSGTGSASTSSDPTANILVPWKSIYANVPLMIQSAWTDSQTGYFSLTAARSVTIPDYPSSAPINTKYTYQLSTSSSLNGPYTAGSVVTGWY